MHATEAVSHYVSEKSCERDRFETNIATVQHDRRCSVTAGSIWTDSQALVLHWTTASSILGKDPPTVLVAEREKNLWSRMGRCQENYAMWYTGKGVLTGQRNHRQRLFFEGYLLWLAQLATPDSSFARSQSCHSLSRFTSTVRVFYSEEESTTTEKA